MRTFSDEEARKRIEEITTIIRVEYVVSRLDGVGPPHTLQRLLDERLQLRKQLGER